jgi:hypothetical protein
MDMGNSRKFVLKQYKVEAFCRTTAISWPQVLHLAADDSCRKPFERAVTGLVFPFQLDKAYRLKSLIVSRSMSVN